MRSSPATRALRAKVGEEGMRVLWIAVDVLGALAAPEATISLHASWILEGEPLALNHFQGGERLQITDLRGQKGKAVAEPQDESIEMSQIEKPLSKRPDLGGIPLLVLAPLSWGAKRLSASHSSTPPR